MNSAALAVRVLVLGLAAYLLFVGLPVLQRLRRGETAPGPPRLPPEFEWVDKTKGLRILHFYAAPGAIRRGDEISLCYGTAQANAVRIEAGPRREALPGVWPSFNRCVIVAPRRDIRYTLIAEDAFGARREIRLEVTVLAPAPRSPAPH